MPIRRKRFCFFLFFFIIKAQLSSSGRSVATWASGGNHFWNSRGDSQSLHRSDTPERYNNDKKEHEGQKGNKRGNREHVRKDDLGPGIKV